MGIVIHTVGSLTTEQQYRDHAWTLVRELETAISILA